MSNLFKSKVESKSGSDRDHGLINHSIICLFRVVEKLAHVHSVRGSDEDLLEEGRRWCLLLPTCKWLACLRQLCVVMDWHWWWWGKNSYFWHVRSPVRMNNILPSCMGHIFKTKVLLVTMTMTKIRWLTLLLLYWSRMDDTLPSCWGHVSIAHTVECYESPPGNFNFDQLHIENDGDNIIMLTTDGWIMIVRKSVFYKKRGIPKTVFKKKYKKIQKNLPKITKDCPPSWQTVRWLRARDGKLQNCEEY